MRISDWSSDVCSSDLDLVCGMTVDPEKTAHHATYAGHDYHFCSAGCREKFIADPDAHLNKRSEEHTSELQSLMRISYAVFCLKKKNIIASTAIITQLADI